MTPGLGARGHLFLRFRSGAMSSDLAREAYLRTGPTGGMMIGTDW